MSEENNIKKGNLIDLTMTFEYPHIVENGKPKTKTINIKRAEALKIGAIILSKVIYQKISDKGYLTDGENPTDQVLDAFIPDGGLSATSDGSENAMVLLYTEAVDGEEVYGTCTGHKEDWVE